MKQKYLAILGLCLAVAATFGAQQNSRAESPPPDQTDTDSGGGGPGGDGAGNGGGDQKDRGGQQTSSPPCNLTNAPNWFPAGPPVGESIQELGSPLKIVVRTITYDTGGHFVYSYFSTLDDPITPVPGTGEQWTQYDSAGNAVQQSYCVN